MDDFDLDDLNFLDDHAWTEEMVTALKKVGCEIRSSSPVQPRKKKKYMCSKCGKEKGQNHVCTYSPSTIECFCSVYASYDSVYRRCIYCKRWEKSLKRDGRFSCSDCKSGKGIDYFNEKKVTCSQCDRICHYTCTAISDTSDKPYTCPLCALWCPMTT